jgi:replicative DNA helicase
VIEATANHKFRMLTGWRRLDELEVGARIALPRHIPTTARGSLSDAEVGLLGHLIGDGCTLPRHAIQYTTCELEAALAQSDIYWDELTAIEPRVETEVYDLTVDRLHNFVAGDVIAHNSLEQDSDLVVFLYREEMYGPTEESAGIAEAIIGKQRNGPIGAIKLAFLKEFTRFENLWQDAGASFYHDGASE